MNTILILAMTLGFVPGPSAPPPAPCSLLKTAEIQALVPGSPVPTGIASTQPLGGVACQYTWPGRTSATLQVIVNDLAQTFPGMSPATIRQGLLAQVRQGAVVVPGVGDAAIFESDDPIRAKGTALLKGRSLMVVFEGPSAGAKKDQVIVLLRAAAGRM